ncbi:serine/arginine repetitive matrix protein 1-like [Pollicipes pollicipes]|uniref:serine/arginine repetitive matrix protein 1-like n=1 Tax=Pollicipes pollicipes TaxID=41117 RepID=UPI00188510BC|nr:serine/arginine repetitive matrix protein 1-like [Pollicipes pollicipes]
MASAGVRVSELGRRKRDELRARQQQRGPAPLASLEDISVDRSVDHSLDMEESERRPGWHQLALPSPRIQVSKASSSGSDGSGATSPETDLLRTGFQEGAAELLGATDELGTPQLAPRKDSVSSAGSELILPASGRSSRLSSFCSTASGRRSVSPYRTMLETSFCGSRPLRRACPSPTVERRARPSPMAEKRACPSPMVERSACPSPPVERRACTLPPHQAPPPAAGRKSSLVQIHRRDESLSPAKTPDSPSPRRKSSFSRLLREARSELRERSRSRSKSKEHDREDGKGSILSLFKRKKDQAPRKSDAGCERTPTRSPSLENRLEENINKVEFKFYDGDSPAPTAPHCNSVSPAVEAKERKGPDAPVVKGYGDVMKELNSTLHQRTPRSAGDAPPPALPVKSPSRQRHQFGASSVEHDLPRPAPAQPEHRVPPQGGAGTVATETRQATAHQSDADAEARSVRSSGSDKESSAAEPAAAAGPDVEAAQLFQADSDEDELPYVPTTLPQERPLQQPIVPVEQRGQAMRCTAGLQRPHATREFTPADIGQFVSDTTDRRHAARPARAHPHPAGQPQVDPHAQAHGREELVAVRARGPAEPAAAASGARRRHADGDHRLGRESARERASLRAFAGGGGGSVAAGRQPGGSAQLMGPRGRALAASTSCGQLSRSPVELRQMELRREEIETRLSGAGCALLHQQTTVLADTLEDATLSYLRAVEQNRPSRSPSPHKMLIETSFCGRAPLQPPGSFEMDDLVDISQLPSETGSLHTDTDSSGRQSQDGCVCRCHSDAEEQEQEQEPVERERGQELQERLSNGREEG